MRLIDLTPRWKIGPIIGSSLGSLVFRGGLEGRIRWEREGEIFSFLSAPPTSQQHHFFFFFGKNTNNGLRLLKNSTYGSAPIKLSSCFCSQDISHFYMILSGDSVGGGLWRVRQRLVREWDQNKKVFFLSFAIILAGIIKLFRITFRFGLEERCCRGLRLLRKCSSWLHWGNSYFQYTFSRLVDILESYTHGYIQVKKL